MKRILLALILPLFVSCASMFEGRFTEARAAWGEALTTQAEKQQAANDKLQGELAQSRADLAAGLKDAEEHADDVAKAAEERADTIGESLDNLGASVGRTWDELKEGVKDDINAVKDSAKAAAGGLMGFGPIADLLGAVGVAVATANAARNRGFPGTTRIKPPSPPT